jgi:anti-sigma B factor antagonist
LSGPPERGQPDEASALRVGSLTVTVSETEGGRLLELSGTLDLSTTATLESALRQAEASELAAVVLDLSGLRFIDSTGLRTILLADRRTRLAGRRLTLVRGPRAVNRVFNVTGADRELEFLD